MRKLTDYGPAVAPASITAAPPLCRGGCMYERCATGTLTKYGWDGTQLWTHEIGTASENSSVTGLAIDAHDQIYAVENQPLSLLAPDGTTLWSRSVFPAGATIDGLTVAHNHLVAAGQAMSTMTWGASTVTGASDGYAGAPILGALDNDGHLLWARALSSKPLGAAAVVARPDGSVAGLVGWQGWQSDACGDRSIQLFDNTGQPIGRYDFPATACDSNPYPHQFSVSSTAAGDLDVATELSGSADFGGGEQTAKDLDVTVFQLSR